MESKASDMTSTSNNFPLQRPSLPWRASSTFVFGTVAALSRSFLYGFNSVEVVGLQRFLDVLDRRKNVEKRERGLITVANHISVLDDPVIWGVLPFRYGFNPSNHRWSLGAHDICFKNKPTGTFFSLGQTLPMHRSQYSQYGGITQPTVVQAIRLLSSPPYSNLAPLKASPSPVPEAPSIEDLQDPFTSGGLTYSTNGTDSYVAPSAYASNRHSWVHVFPEACVHQHPTLSMRYFKWGVSRLILEADPLPEVLPMFISGTHKIMAEDRTWPRFVPRVGAKVRVAFGEVVDGEEVFGDLRRRWQALVKKDLEARGGEERGLVMGELTEELHFGKEATELRIEVARRLRSQVERVRREQGWPEEEPGLELAETWRREPHEKEFKSPVDESLNKKE